MAQLHSLIRFQRHNLDEKRRLLAALQAEKEQLQEYKQKLLDNLTREKNLAAVDLDSARHFPQYMAHVKEQIEALDTAIFEKDLEIQAATFVVQEAYLEVKKLEITQEKRDQEEYDRLTRLENIDLDEMGLNSFRRNQEEGDKG